jgi:dTDP-4-dehydrorhamnose reductase
MSSAKAILIVGGSGTIGTQLALELRESHRVYATYLKTPFRMDGVTPIPLSLADRTWCKRISYTLHPEVIIYCAGNNDPDFAGRNERIAELAHSAGPANLLGTTDFGAPKFIYLSSSYVFDGGKGNYRESDVVLPASNLGKYKVGGENYIRGKSVNYVIVRSGPLVTQGNGYTRTFLDRLLQGLSRGERMTLPSNDLYSFTHISSLRTLISRLVDAGVRNKTIHCTGLARVSYYDFARLLAQRFGYDPSLVVPSGGIVQGAAVSYQGGKATISAAPSHLDFSLNGSASVEMLKLKPLLLEECFDLIEKDLVRSGSPAA